MKPTIFREVPKMNGWKDKFVAALIGGFITFVATALSVYGKVEKNTYRIDNVEQAIMEMRSDIKEILKEMRLR